MQWPPDQNTVPERFADFTATVLIPYQARFGLGAQCLFAVGKSCSTALLPSGGRLAFRAYAVADPLAIEVLLAQHATPDLALRIGSWLLFLGSVSHISNVRALSPV